MHSFSCAQNEHFLLGSLEVRGPSWCFPAGVSQYYSLREIFALVTSGSASFTPVAFTDLLFSQVSEISLKEFSSVSFADIGSG